MEAKVSWNGPSGMSFKAETGSGHTVLMDGAVEGGGHNSAAAADGNGVTRHRRLHGV